MKKKGELTTQQIIGLIILIASFAIILIFIFGLDLGDTSNKEICHNSVILSEKSVLNKGLDCRTDYVCVSGGEDCENFNPSRTIKISDVSNKEEIMKVIADEMADCWWMFGEGKIDYVSRLTSAHCAICSIVKFDKNIPLISSSEFSEFLEKNFYSEFQTYSKYLYGEPNVPSYGYLEDIDFNSRYSIVTGIDESLAGDRFIRPFFVKSEDVETKTGCKVFDITKA